MAYITPTIEGGDEVGDDFIIHGEMDAGDILKVQADPTEVWVIQGVVFEDIIDYAYTDGTYRTVWRLEADSEPGSFQFVKWPCGNVNYMEFTNQSGNDNVGITVIGYRSK